MTTSRLPFRSLGRWLPSLILLALLLIAPIVLEPFRLGLLGKFITYAIVAIALDLIWGYCGILSLGQGVFFGLGAYAMAMHLKLEASGGQPLDFMLWSGLNDLPWFWAPFREPWFALLMVVVLPMLLAGLLAYMCFRSRIIGVYFSLITQALSLMMVTLIVGQQPYTGGTNGMTNLSTMFGFDLRDVGVQRGLYVVSVLVLVLIFLLCTWITHSRFGQLLVALRDDESRARFNGYNPALVKAIVFALAAGLSGIAGALFVPQVGIITPSEMGIVPSVGMVIWVAVGGRGTLIGAVIGALLVNGVETALSESFPAIWQLFLGALFLGVVLLFPRGVVGAAIDLWEWASRRSGAIPPPLVAERQEELG
ncbi:MAG: urea ABC transporter permease subunit UrtC [Roseiflexaceae bacterium]